MNRRSFLKLGALFVPVAAAPTVAYSFPWTPQKNWLDQFAEQWNMPQRGASESDTIFKARLRDVFLFSTMAPGTRFRIARSLAVGLAAHQ